MSKTNSGKGWFYSIFDSKIYTLPVFAERLGFEPRVHFWRTHTFQACSFDHSDTSPG